MGDMQVDSRAPLLEAHQPVEQFSIEHDGWLAPAARALLEVWRPRTLDPTTPMVRVFGRVLAAFAKRCADILGALAGLVLLSPVLAIVALLVRLDSPGGPIYGSWRLTMCGRRFRCWKFRTMYADSQSRLELYFARAPGARREYERFHKLEHDPRVTRIGRVLRSSSLDEIPQLFNVLVGEMSFVGPRPYLVDELASNPRAHVILAVKPGITGLWQVSGRNELTFRQRVRIECFYSRRRSLGWDAVLLARTLSVVVRRRGAR